MSILIVGGRDMRVNYDEFTVTCDSVPSKESLSNFYSLLIDNLLDRYGSELIKYAINKLREE